MTDVDSEPIIRKLIQTAVGFSRTVAAFLARCEEVLEFGSGEQQLSTSQLTEDSLIASLRGSVDRERVPWSKALDAALLEMPELYFSEPRSRTRVTRHWERRLARVTLHAWREQVRPGKARRPDVLALTCALLTNPEAVHTHDVVRSAVVLLLRSLYGIERDKASLNALRATYSSLSRRLGAQERARVRKHESGVEPFLIDLLCLEGWISRAATRSQREAYHLGFQREPFGIRKQIRGFGPGIWPEIHGELPDFPSLLNIVFNQPTGMPGLDDVTGGLMVSIADDATESSRGLVTLVTGPPGSGKTSLCLSMASRMADLGSQVSYVATEEDVTALEAKLTALNEQNQLARLLWPSGVLRRPRSGFHLRPGKDFDDLSQIVDQLASDLKNAAANHVQNPPRSGHRIDIVFPWVVVIDSLTTLLNTDVAEQEHRLPQTQILAGQQRRWVAALLERLRQLGVAVFLVGGLDDATQNGIAYLVDNSFTLGLDRLTSERHPVRTFTVEKTRLQLSYRGRHVFHLSRFDGCMVNPSMHAVLRKTKRHRLVPEDRCARAVLCAQQEPRKKARVITIRDRSHVVVWGWGSSGKAKLGLWLTLEPRLPEEPVGAWNEYVALRARDASTGSRKLTPGEQACISRSRTLVVSFLHDVDYYRKIGCELLVKRFSLSARDARDGVDARVKTIDLYPGFIDPETLLARIGRELRGARFDGRPFTGVMIDGIHNLLLQFPMLAREPLLWPALFRMLRSENVNTISTYTFFTIGRNTSASPEEPLAPDDAGKLLCHLLVSSCNYSLQVSATRNRLMHVERTSASEDLRGEEEDFDWDPRRYTAVEAVDENGVRLGSAPLPSPGKHRPRNASATSTPRSRG